jgi:hypothetical protein
MKTKFIYLFLIVFASCATPQKVKDASHIQNESLKLFVEENTKFYSIVQATIESSIDAQISALELNLKNKIENDEIAINELNEEIKNNPNLSTAEKLNQIASNERYLYDSKLKNKDVIEKDIQIQINRKNKVQQSIFILTSMQEALFNSNMKLNEYIQLKKAHEYLLEEVKNTFPQLSYKMTQFESILQEF